MNPKDRSLGEMSYWLLPGQYFDRETNTHYNYFRDYDPAQGRYIQSDAIGLQGGINTYAYAGGSPVSHVDVRGLDFPGTIAMMNGVPPNTTPLSVTFPGQVGTIDPSLSPTAQVNWGLMGGPIANTMLFGTVAGGAGALGVSFWYAGGALALDAPHLVITGMMLGAGAAGTFVIVATAGYAGYRIYQYYTARTQPGLPLRSSPQLSSPLACR